ncbi:MAG TPA: hypothetical protein VGE34_03245 [Candidatus Saccharimonadales bacterium]
MEKQLNQNGQNLTNLLHQAKQRVTHRRDHEKRAQKVHIVGAGGTVTAAYEQLRNAAEYAEEHMLLQRAIRRFYRRLFLLRDDKQIKNSGEELAVELTLAGYLLNDSVPESTVAEISKLAREYYTAYEDLHKQRLTHDQVEQWTLDVLSVRVEWLLNDPSVSSAYLQFVYDYYVSSPAVERLFEKTPEDLSPAIFVAIQRALLKSDPAIIRTALLGRYQQSTEHLGNYIATNKQIDTLLSSATVERLYRYIDRHGAPFRVLRHMLDDESTADTLDKPNEFLSRFESQILADYEAINSKINRGIIKSVIFLIITKVLIGLALEIPYDYFVLGTIAVTPLVINLLFPPLYMVLLRMTLFLPGAANTRRLVDQMEEILYGEQAKQLRRKATSFGVGFNVAYGLISLIVFTGVGYWLWRSFEFELMHLFIFFLFLSGASFLGFRLSRMIREVEAIDSNQNFVTTIRDVLYMPFVVVGRYMSEKYAQVNIVALSLDMLIELPLKTILRLIRQWGAFISNKQDEL